MINRSFSPGDMLAGRYEVLSYIGSGGLGEVYRVKDRSDNSILALKLFLERALPVSIPLSRVEQVLGSAAPRAEGIVAPLAFVQHEQRKAVLMPIVDGQGLDKLLAGRNAPLSTAEAATICDAVARRLLDIPPDKVHGDLKPGNVLLRNGLDNGIEVLLSDFGTSRLLPFSRFASIQLGLGAVYSYMAPEAVTFGGNTDRRADIYALGMLLMELLTGQVPKRGPARPRQVLADVPEDLDELVAATCERDPAKRLVDLGLFSAMLQPFLPQPAPAEPEPEPEPEIERIAVSEIEPVQAFEPEPISATDEQATQNFLERAGSEVHREARELFGDYQIKTSDAAAEPEQQSGPAQPIAVEPSKTAAALRKPAPRWALWIALIVALAVSGLIIFLAVMPD